MVDLSIETPKGKRRWRWDGIGHNVWQWLTTALIIVFSLLVAAAVVLFCFAVGPVLLMLALVLIPLGMVFSTPSRRRRHR